MLFQNSKQYLLIDSIGKEYIADRGLKEFCREHNLTSSNLYKTLSGERNTHKGWKLIKEII
jgi:DNA-binding phage protein